MSTRNPEVDAWPAGHDTPPKPLVEQVRTIVLAAIVRARCNARDTA